jgi:hypothetical protein
MLHCKLDTISKIGNAIQEETVAEVAPQSVNWQVAKRLASAKRQVANSSDGYNIP